MAPAALAALAAFCVMGAFEYNFGDAEPSTLLLGLVALPFTGGRRAEARSKAGPAAAPMTESRAPAAVPE
jgi:hypothetical protein